MYPRGAVWGQTEEDSGWRIGTISLGERQYIVVEKEVE